jgi:hypothetical protein
MANWIVTVQTDSSQIKEVFVEDYNHPEDAAQAALSQTGASKVLYTIEDYSYKSTSSSGTGSYDGSSTTSYDSDLNGVEGGLLCLAGISIFLGMFSKVFFNIFIILLISTFAHYIIRKIKEELL